MLEKLKLFVTLAVLAIPLEVAANATILNPVLLADFPIELQSSNGLLLEVPLVETKRFSEWNYQSGLRPESYEIVAVVQLSESLWEDKVHISASVHRRVASFKSLENQLDTPVGDWEPDPILKLDKTITVSGSERFRIVRFGKKPTEDIWLALWENELWPTEVRVDLELSCDTCELDQKSITIPFIPGD